MSARTALFLRRGKELIEVDGRRVLIGRSRDCDVQTDDTGISRRHCEIVLYPDRITVRDLGSRHGTFVDGKKVSGEGIAHTGSVISLGPRGPRYQLAGAIVNGTPVGRTATAGTAKPAAAAAAAPAARAPRGGGFGGGLLWGIAVGVVLGVVALALVDVSPWIDAAREAVGR